MNGQKIGVAVLLFMIVAVVGVLIYGIVQTSSQPAPSAAATADQAKLVQTPTLPALTAVATAGPVKAEVTQAAAQSPQTPQAAAIPDWIIWAVVIVGVPLGLWGLWHIIKALIPWVWELIKENRLAVATFLMFSIYALINPDINNVINEKPWVGVLLFFAFALLAALLGWIFHKISLFIRRQAYDMRYMTRPLGGGSEYVSCPRCGRGIDINGGFVMVEMDGRRNKTCPSCGQVIKVAGDPYDED